MMSQDKATKSPKEESSPEDKIWKLIGDLAAHGGKVQDAISENIKVFHEIGIYEATVMTRKVTPGALDEDIGFISGGQGSAMLVVKEFLKSKADDEWKRSGVPQAKRSEIAGKIEKRLDAFLSALKEPDIYRKEPKAFLHFFQSMQQQQRDAGNSPNTLFVSGDSPIPHVLLIESGELDFFCILLFLRSLYRSQTGSSVDGGPLSLNLKWLKLGFFVAGTSDESVRITPRWRIFTQWLEVCRSRVKQCVDFEKLRGLCASIEKNEVPNDDLAAMVHCCGLPVKILKEYPLQEAALLVGILDFFYSLPDGLTKSLHTIDGNSLVSDEHLQEFVTRLKDLVRTAERYKSVMPEESDPIVNLARPPNLAHEYNIRAYQPLPLHIIAVATGFKQFASVRVPSSLVLATLKGTLFEGNPEAEQRRVLGAYWALMSFLATETASAKLEEEAIKAGEEAGKETVWESFRHELRDGIKLIFEGVLVPVERFKGSVSTDELYKLLFSGDYTEDIYICPAYRAVDSLRDLLLLWASKGPDRSLQDKLERKKPLEVIKILACAAMRLHSYQLWGGSLFIEATAKRMPEMHKQMDKIEREVKELIDKVDWRPKTFGSEFEWCGGRGGDAENRQERQLNFFRLITALFLNLRKHLPQGAPYVCCSLEWKEKGKRLRFSLENVAKPPDEDYDRLRQIVGGLREKFDEMTEDPRCVIEAYRPYIKEAGSFRTIKDAAEKLGGLIEQPNYFIREEEIKRKEDPQLYFSVAVIFSCDKLFQEVSDAK